MLLIQYGRVGSFLRETVLTAETTVTVGRDRSCTVSLSDKNVSGVHLQFRVHDAQVFVEDMQSTNGTFVNGEPASAQPLRPHDVVGIGLGHIELTAEWLTGARADAARQQYERRQAVLVATADTAMRPLEERVRLLEMEVARLAEDKEQLRSEVEKLRAVKLDQ